MSAMLPVNLDLARLKLALVGNGPAAARRLAELDRSGARDVTVYSEKPCAALAAQAGERLVSYLPNAVDINAAAVLLVVDLPEDKAGDLAATARAVGTLVNVEDATPFCDFHFLSRIQRGDLTVAVSTGGKSPRLAGRLRRAIESWLVPQWAERLEELAAQRRLWQAQGQNMTRLRQLTDDYIDRQGWL